VFSFWSKSNRPRSNELGLAAGQLLLPTAAGDFGLCRTVIFRAGFAARPLNRTAFRGLVGDTGQEHFVYIFFVNHSCVGLGLVSSDGVPGCVVGWKPLGTWSVNPVSDQRPSASELSNHVAEREFANLGDFIPVADRDAGFGVYLLAGLSHFGRVLSIPFPQPNRRPGPPMPQGQQVLRG
jgi:hypothetical protein